ncbi:hypothetical protein BRDID11002_15180 [Bradyrhizobium diazoefficiens]
MRSEIFIDCSGDGDLAVWAGAPFEVGDEHGHPLYPSMMLRLNNIDPEKAGEAWRTIPQLMKRRSPPAPTNSRGKVPSCGRRNPASNGG